ncbi:MAG: hypothetical protein BZ138_00705 [Methanosphaera sp. rholeuAM270]|nr:MAG: hypothetical protein BZ138_00705 [Methanosphaera sp. rholeuAM270]
MSKTLISVIVPVFNCEKYLEDCIESLNNQSFTDYEVVFVDDGSTDGSGRILDEYKLRDNRFNVFHKENEGPASARNYALKHAEGEFVLFLDSDDWLENNTLETLYNTAKNNDSELVLFNSIEHYKNDVTKIREYHIIGEDNDFENFSFDYNNNINLVMNGYHIVCTKLHKLSFIKDNNMEFSDKKEFEDVLFHIKSMIYAKRISYNPGILYHYRRTKTESRQNKAITSIKSLEFFEIFEEAYDFLESEGLYDKFRINYYKFVINESMNIEEKIDSKYRESFFSTANTFFNNLKIDNQDLKRLPLEQQYFYNNISTSKDISEFDKNREMNRKKIKIHEKSIRIRQKIRKIIKH